MGDLQSADGVFAFADAFSKATHRAARIREINAELLRTGNRCGDCYFWMKSRDCPRERNVNGMSHGPSAGGLPCSKMHETSASLDRRAKLQSELLSLRAEDSSHV